MSIASAVQEFARAHGGLITTRQAVDLGARVQRLSEWARRGVIARVARGVYAVGAMTDLDPRRVTAAHRVTLGLESAAAWLGVELPAAIKLMQVIAPRNRGRRGDAIKGVRLRRANLRPDEIVVVRGVPVTSPLRTSLDLARHASLEHAVAIIDAMLRLKLFSLEEFVAAASRQQGPGRARLQLVASLVDPNSGSILESLARLLLWRNRLPSPVSQYWLRHRRLGPIGRMDFAWPDLLVILECDGYEFHAAREPFQKDRRRWSAVTRIGWRIAVVTWFDVTCDPGYVVALVRDLLSPDPEDQHTIVTSATPEVAA